MPKRLWGFLFCLCFVFPPVSINAKEVKKGKPKTAPETQASQPEAPSTPAGALLFFPSEPTRPPEGRFPIQPGQTLSICLKLFPTDSQVLNQLQDKLMGYRVVMEDNTDPPRQIPLIVGNRLVPLKPDEQGCLMGEVVLPTPTRSGVYQVADLFLATADQSYYSMREDLYSFSAADELEVTNPQEDPQAPRLVKIESFSSPQGRMKVISNIIKIRIDQIFQFEDEESGIERKSLKVFYNLEVDGHVVGTPKAICHSTRPHTRFHCILRVDDPKVMWGLQKVALVLNSIQLKDKAGNEMNLKDPQVFANKAQDSHVRFEFSREDWPVKSKYNLNKDKVY